MARIIRCSKCNCYLGEIRDAKLSKSLVTSCDKCVDREIEMKSNFFRGLDRLAKKPNKKDFY